METGNSVTIVITCFNHAEFLEKAIVSAVNQTDSVEEIIVVDDGSTDNTKEISNSFNDITYVYQENQGLSAARNAGLGLANSKYVIFLDADDVLEREAVRCGLSCFQRYPESAFVSGKHVYIDRQGSPKGGPPDIHLPSDKYLQFLRGNYIGMHATVMYRRDVLNKFDGFDNSLQCCEDYDLYLRISRQNAVNTHRYVTAKYRIYPGTMSTNNRSMLSTVLQVLKRQKKYLKNNSEYLDGWREGQKAWFNLYGGAAIDLALSELRKGRVSSFIQNLVIPARVSPLGAAKITSKKIARKVGKRLPRKPGRYPRVNGRSFFGRINFGSLNRTRPISDEFGFDRGLPIDRYYIEQFLIENSAVIKGTVLEIGDNTYTNQFGSDQVLKSECLHLYDSKATYTGNLIGNPSLPDNYFDCVIFTQTLHLIYDFKEAIATLERILAPGGTLLLTVPGISQISSDEWAESWFWSFTALSMKKMLVEALPESAVEIVNYGNVKVATGFLFGFAASELTCSDLSFNDARYQLLICARVTKK